MREYRQTRFQRPPAATEILLIRHGESEAAREGAPFPLIDGQGDPALHPNGRQQAERIAARLRSEPIAAVYATSLRRTVETAAPLCRELGLTPQVEAGLREVHLGQWEGGVFRAKAANRDPLYLQVFREQRWDLIPGAESRDSVHHRVRQSLGRIVARHPDQLVVAVVHGGIIGHILAYATESKPFAFIGADNGSISSIVVDGGRTIVRRFNDTTHLMTTGSP